MYYFHCWYWPCSIYFNFLVLRPKLLGLLKLDFNFTDHFYYQCKWAKSNELYNFCITVVTKLFTNEWVGFCHSKRVYQLYKSMARYQDWPVACNHAHCIIIFHSIKKTATVQKLMNKQKLFGKNLAESNSYNMRYKQVLLWKRFIAMPCVCVVG